MCTGHRNRNRGAAHLMASVPALGQVMPLASPPPPRSRAGDGGGSHRPVAPSSVLVMPHSIQPEQRVASSPRRPGCALTSVPVDGSTTERRRTWSDCGVAQDAASSTSRHHQLTAEGYDVGGVVRGVHLPITKANTRWVSTSDGCGSRRGASASRAARRGPAACT